MSHPDALPDLFLDRSLGRIVVPDLLRAAGLRLITLAEHYGIPEDETVTDAEWLELAGSRSWIVFMKDARIRYTPAEREAVKAHRVRCFCLSNQNLAGEAMAARFLDNLEAIVTASSDAGPFIYAVHSRRIERLAIGDD